MENTYKRWIYFAQETFSQSVKIGSSSFPFRRIDQIRVYCPYYVVLLGCIPVSNRMNELATHRRFAKHRMHREWFAPDMIPDIMRLVAKIGWPELSMCLANERDTIVTDERMATLLAVDMPKQVIDLGELADAKTEGGYDREKSQRILASFELLDSEIQPFRKHICSISRKKQESV